MTENFHARFYNYDTSMIPNKEYVKVFPLKNKSRKEILESERLILNLTKEYKYEEGGLESRRGIDKQDLINLIEEKTGITGEKFLNPIRPSAEELERDREVREYVSKGLSEEENPLRDYQQQCVDIFKGKLSGTFFKGIYCLATGLGKSRIGIHICLHHFEKYPDDNILWITFRNDIINSQKEEFSKYLGNRVIFCNDGKFSNTDLKVTGKVIMILRQSLLTKKEDKVTKLPCNLSVQGIIYDECHDASKVEKVIVIEDKEVKTGITYLILKELQKRPDLKYMIGFSATPLTNNLRQSKGVKELYGRCLYNYSLIEACPKWLLKPIIEYIPVDQEICSLNKFYKAVDLKDKNKEHKYSFTELKSMYSTTIDKIRSEIISIINRDELIYKKGIVWLPSIRMVMLFAEILFIHGIAIEYSTSKKESITTEKFIEIPCNMLMLTCDKFTTGFNGKFMEFGINLHLGESGNVTVQKLGRFTRDNKEGQVYAYLFQFCEIESKQFDKVIENICRNLDNLGCDDECMELTKTCNRTIDTVIHDMLRINGIDKKDFEQLKQKVLARQFCGQSLAKYLQYKNKRIVNDSDMPLEELVRHKKLYITRKDCLYYSQYANIPMKESANYIKMCLGEKLFTQISSYFYDSLTLSKVCKCLNIEDIHNYEKNHYINIRLPPYYILNGNGYYNDENKDFNLNLALMNCEDIDF